MQIVIIVMLAVAIVLLAVLVVMVARSGSTTVAAEEVGNVVEKQIGGAIQSQLALVRQDIGNTITSQGSSTQSAVASLGSSLTGSQQTAIQAQRDSLADFRQVMEKRFDDEHRMLMDSLTTLKQDLNQSVGALMSSHQNALENQRTALAEFQKSMELRFNEQKKSLSETLDALSKSLSENVNHLTESQKNAIQSQKESLAEFRSVMESRTDAQKKAMKESMEGLARASGESFGHLQKSLESQMKSMGENTLGLVDQMNKGLTGRIESFGASTTKQMEQLRQSTTGQIDLIKSSTAEQIGQMRQSLSQSVENLTATQQAASQSQKDVLTEFRTSMDSRLATQSEALAQSLEKLDSSSKENAQTLRATVEGQMKVMNDKTVRLVEQMNQGLTGRIDAIGKSTTSQIDVVKQSTTKQIETIGTSTSEQISQMRTSLAENATALNSQLQGSLNSQLEQFRAQSGEQMKKMEERMGALEASSQAKLDAMRESLSTNVNRLRDENNQQLDKIRNTVDEKLQTELEKRLGESFRRVSDQLNQVHQGLGEMKNLASDVGGLKKVLSGVKTRGILGEVQLGNILTDIMSPDQYETNFATVEGSSERVEFAIRMPGTKDDEVVYLPIDAKFPGDTYAALQDAQCIGDKEALEKASAALENRIRAEAKDIRDKYISVPRTTGFGVMFLPTEGLYAEVASRPGLLESLRREFGVNVAGPSTMAAFLNSLQMGFKTLALQKKSQTVWKVLSDVKTEFVKFQDCVKKTQKNLDSVSKSFDDLVGRRYRAMERKLRDVQILDGDGKENAADGLGDGDLGLDERPEE